MLKKSLRIVERIPFAQIMPKASAEVGQSQGEDDQLDDLVDVTTNVLCSHQFVVIIVTIST